MQIVIDIIRFITRHRHTYIIAGTLEHIWPLVVVQVPDVQWWLWDVTPLQLGFVLVGFLTYKTATLSWLWDNDLKPDLIDSITGQKEAEAQFARRPVLAKIPDTEDVLAAKGKSMDK